MYKLTNYSQIIRLEDNTIIPTTDPTNKDYLEYLQWVSDGNAPQPADPPPPAPPNWIGVLSQVRGTVLFQKTYGLSKSSLSVQTAFTLLISTLNAAAPNLNDFRFSLNDLKTEMGSNLTQADIAEMNSILSANNFPFQI